MKSAGEPFDRVKPDVPLATWPVGPSGTPTTSGTIATDDGSLGVPPRYSVDLSVPWSETQTGEVGNFDIPHAFTRLGSTTAAPYPARLATRFVCRTCGPAAGPAPAMPGETTASDATTTAVAALAAMRLPRGRTACTSSMAASFVATVSVGLIRAKGTTGDA